MMKLLLYETLYEDRYQSYLIDSRLWLLVISLKLAFICHEGDIPYHNCHAILESYEGWILHPMILIHKYHLYQLCIIVCIFLLLSIYILGSHLLLWEYVTKGPTWPWQSKIESHGGIGRFMARNGMKWYTRDISLTSGRLNTFSPKQNGRRFANDILNVFSPVEIVLFCDFTEDCS